MPDVPVHTLSGELTSLRALLSGRVTVCTMSFRGVTEVRFLLPFTLLLRPHDSAQTAASSWLQPFLERFANEPRAATVRVRVRCFPCHALILSRFFVLLRRLLVMRVRSFAFRCFAIRSFATRALSMQRRLSLCKNNHNNRRTAQYQNNRHCNQHLVQTA